MTWRVYPLPTLSLEERDTLLMCLDFCVSQVCNAGTFNDSGVFARRVAEHHVRALRTKLFPTLRPFTEEKKKDA